MLTCPPDIALDEWRATAQRVADQLERASNDIRAIYVSVLSVLIGESPDNEWLRKRLDDLGPGHADHD